MTNTPKGSITWNLCRRGLEFFNQHLYRIPGNGMKNLLWDDKIKGNAPLNTDSSLSEIKLWLVNKGFLRLPDITSWDKNGNWVAWTFPAYRSKKLVMVKLTGLPPVHSMCKDMWEWGISRNYSVACGFQALQANLVSINNTSFWKAIWNFPSIPKVNFLTWILMQQKSLTFENLSRRVFYGLFR